MNVEYERNARRQAKLRIRGEVERRRAESRRPAPSSLPRRRRRRTHRLRLATEVRM